MSYELTQPLGAVTTTQKLSPLVMFGLAGLGIWWFVKRAEKGYRKNARPTPRNWKHAVAIAKKRKK